ncbi:polysaccharide deacetylase family protein [Oryzihumus sp.]|uniref:polysaccharide deacetylase family protein n=1 Tax=Oryzihumus sp. TaxID=1968903 RepID=UPI002EDA8F99
MRSPRQVAALALTVSVLAVTAACGSSGTGATGPSSTAGVPTTSGRSSTSGPATSTTAHPTPTPTVRPSAPSPSTRASVTTRPTSAPRPTAPAPTRTTPGPVTPALPAHLLGTVVSRIPTTSKVVALTFDAGANGDGVPAILATLQAQHVPASFYLTGDFVRAFPTLARQLAAYGRIGNHTDKHPHLTTLSDAAVRTEVANGAAAITAVTGRSAKPLFRFPFGEYTAHTLSLVNGMGYVAVGWTVDTLGWKGTSGGQSVSTVVSRVVAARTPGEIVLMHVGSNPDDHTTLDAGALPQVISQLRSYGYSFVTLSALGI